MTPKGWLDRGLLKIVMSTLVRHRRFLDFCLILKTQQLESQSKIFEGATLFQSIFPCVHSCCPGCSCNVILVSTIRNCPLITLHVPSSPRAELTSLFILKTLRKTGLCVIVITKDWGNSNRVRAFKDKPLKMFTDTHVYYENMRCK